MTDKRCLAAANFARHDGKAGPVHNAIFEHGIGQRMTVTPIQVIGVRQNRKRFLRQSVKLSIHICLPSPVI